MKIAVLGLGLMGAAIAMRLVERGFEVVGWNRDPAKARALSEQGLNTVATVGDALASCDFVVLVLSDAAAIEQTLLTPDLEGALAGKCIVQMGTIGPEESRAIAARVAASGGEYLEAPVLGSLPEARAGRLIVMVGGEAPLFERCQPLLGALGEAPRLIGPVGQGAALKLAMNQLIAGLTATFSLSLGLVRSEGIDATQFMELLRTSALYAPTFDKKLDKYLSHDYGKANFPLKHLLKDVRLFQRVGEGAGLDTGLLAAVEAACERAVEMGHADQDYSSLYEALTRR